MRNSTNRHVRLLLCGLALPLIVAAAPDSPWGHAGRYAPPGRVGITVYVNMDSMRRAGPNRLLAWIKYANDRPDAQGVAETLVYERLECDRDWHSTISLMMYDARGNVLTSEKGNADDAELIVPDSLLSGIMPFTCAVGGMPH